MLVSQSPQRADGVQQGSAGNEATRHEVINPLSFAGWDQLLATHNESQFFHTAAWARVLNETYGHKPFYFSAIADGQLQALLPLMEVSSRVTGRRGVSLPFSDFCPSLRTAGGSELYESAMGEGRRRGWHYLECRGNDSPWSRSSPSVGFYGHSISLAVAEQELFAGLDAAMRRAIRKANEAKLEVRFETSAGAMDDFYKLHCGTRRRHGVPPQPRRFFENICRYVFSRDHGFVAIACLEGRPVAAAVFFHYRGQAIFKFGASDFHFQHLRANNLVMWEAIKHLAVAGCESLHLGRTSLSNEGLRRFKLGFGAREERIEYRKYDFRRESFVTDTDRAESWVNLLFKLFPEPLLRLAGAMVYPHLS